MDLASQTAKPTKYVTTTCFHKAAAPTHVPFERKKRPLAQQGCDSKFRDSVRADLVCV